MHSRNRWDSDLARHHPHGVLYEDKHRWPMADGRYIAYYRVSTAQQGRSGLGLEGQRAPIAAFLNGGGWQLLGEFTEVESGADNARPELAKALNTCRLKGGALVIAKLDRLSRDAHFLLGARGLEGRAKGGRAAWRRGQQEAGRSVRGDVGAGHR